VGDDDRELLDERRGRAVSRSLSSVGSVGHSALGDSGENFSGF